jgi:hypothetical protein
MSEEALQKLASIEALSQNSDCSPLPKCLNQGKKRSSCQKRFPACVAAATVGGSLEQVLQEENRGLH